jgi:hypothetical protein
VQLTFAAKQFYVDGDIVSFYQQRIGESCYGTFNESAGFRAQLLKFEFDVAGDGVAPGNIAVNISAAVTDVEVRNAFYTAAYGLGSPILFFAAGAGAMMRIVGKRTQHCADSFGGTGMAPTKTTLHWVRTSTPTTPPLANLGGRGIIMAPMDRRQGAVDRIHEGELLYGNHDIT